MTDTVSEFIVDKGISEIIHFTTNQGLLGILARRYVLSRFRLDSDELTQGVQLPVWTVRKDPDWSDYVNLSITEMSTRMFATSRERHGSDVWWAVLSFSPEILTHDGVFFTTTNNTYTSTVRRGEGAEALMDQWSASVPWGWYGSRSYRHAYVPANRPTDPQAEVLYPIAVSLDFLQAVYVREEEHIDDVEGWKAATGNEHVPVSCRPEVFK